MTYVHPILLITEDLKTMDDPLPSSMCIYWPNLLCGGSSQVCIALHVSV